jgi:hypothetical protein
MKGPNNKGSFSKSIGKGGGIGVTGASGYNTGYIKDLETNKAELMNIIQEFSMKYEAL